MNEVVAVANNARLDHFAKQVVALAGTLAYASKNRKSAVAFGNVVNEFLNQYGLANTGTAKQTNFTALSVGLDQVNYFNSSQKNLGRGGQVFKLGGAAVNRNSAVAHIHGTQTVDVGSDHVEHATADLVARWHSNRKTGGYNLLTAGEAVGRVHRNRADGVFANVLLRFKNDLLAVRARYNKRIVDFWKSLCIRKVDVYNRANDLGNFTIRVRHVL